MNWDVLQDPSAASLEQTALRTLGEESRVAFAQSDHSLHSDSVFILFCVVEPGSRVHISFMKEMDGNDGSHTFKSRLINSVIPPLRLGSRVARDHSPGCAGVAPHQDRGGGLFWRAQRQTMGQKVLAQIFVYFCILATY